MTAVASVGECMIELRHVDEDTLALGYGGDTYNTAVYLARYADDVGATVDYVTALGTDPYSERMLERWHAEGVGSDLVVRLADRIPGLYLIRTDESGERSFTYYRSEAAARQMLRGGHADALVEALARFDWLYLSGITLSILDADSRARLWDALDRARDRGGRVAFDSNYRPVGWPHADVAREAIEATLRRVDLALPTLGDEQVLFGHARAEDAVAHLHRLGVAEVALKLSTEGCLVSCGGRTWQVPAVPADRVVDTTAAGDAFNAGYLAARIAGAPPDTAARCGNRLAREVVAHPGAVMPRAATPTLDLERAR